MGSSTSKAQSVSREKKREDAVTKLMSQREALLEYYEKKKENIDQLAEKTKVLLGSKETKEAISAWKEKKKQEELVKDILKHLDDIEKMVDSIGTKHDDIIETIKSVTVDEIKMKEFELGEQEYKESQNQLKTSKQEESDELQLEPVAQKLEKEVELYFSEKETATSVDNSEDDEDKSNSDAKTKNSSRRDPIEVEETENSTEEPDSLDNAPSSQDEAQDEEPEVIIIRKKYEPTWIESALQAVVAPGISNNQVKVLHAVFVALVSLILTWMYVIYMRKFRFQVDLLFHLGVFLFIALTLYGLTQWVLYKLDYLSPVNSEELENEPRISQAVSAKKEKKDQ